MGKYTPRPVPRGFFDMSSRTNAYEVLLHRCWAVSYWASNPDNARLRCVRERVSDLVDDIDNLVTTVDGPRSIRVGAYRAASRAMRVARRILRTRETA